MNLYSVVGLNGETEKVYHLLHLNWQNMYSHRGKKIRRFVLQECLLKKKALWMQAKHEYHYENKSVDWNSCTCKCKNIRN